MNSLSQSFSDSVLIISAMITLVFWEVCLLKFLGFLCPDFVEVKDKKEKQINKQKHVNDDQHYFISNFRPMI